MRIVILIVITICLIGGLTMIWIGVFTKSNGNESQIVYEGKSYPKEIPFEQGMTLYPGQSAVIEIPLIIELDSEAEKRTY